MTCSEGTPIACNPRHVLCDLFFIAIRRGTARHNNYTGGVRNRLMGTLDHRGLFSMHRFGGMSRPPSLNWMVLDGPPNDPEALAAHSSVVFDTALMLWDGWVCLQVRAAYLGKRSAVVTIQRAVRKSPKLYLAHKVAALRFQQAVLVCQVGYARCLGSFTSDVHRPTLGARTAVIVTSPMLTADCKASTGTNEKKENKQKTMAGSIRFVNWS